MRDWAINTSKRYRGTVRKGVAAYCGRPSLYIFSFVICEVFILKMLYEICVVVRMLSIP